MQTIGYMQTLFKFKNGTPRQAGICQHARGTLTINKSIFNNPEHSLEGLQDFSHAWVIFVFHKNNNAYFKAKVRPPRLDGRRIGLFATRAPYRPNPIGLTLAKIEKISGASIHFSGIDLLDGTPVLDVKPYIPQYDCPLGTYHAEFQSEQKNTELQSHPANNQSTNAVSCLSSDFNKQNASLNQIPIQDISGSIGSSDRSKNSGNTVKITCPSQTNSTYLLAEDSMMSELNSIETDISGITEKDVDLEMKTTNFLFASQNYCLKDESLSKEGFQKAETEEISTQASSQGSEVAKETASEASTNNPVSLSKSSFQSTLLTVTNFVGLTSDAITTPSFATKKSVALTPVVSTPLTTTLVVSTPLTTTLVVSTPLTTTLSISTPLTTTPSVIFTPVIQNVVTSPTIATAPSVNTTSMLPLVSADWVVKAPVPKLRVLFTERSHLQLQMFSENCKQQEFQLEYLQDSQEVCQAISSILSEDPRSVYRRNLCKDSLYYFSVDKVHVTCWFFGNSVEVLRIQPTSCSEQTKEE